MSLPLGYHSRCVYHRKQGKRIILCCLNPRTTAEMEKQGFVGDTWEDQRIAPVKFQHPIVLCKTHFEVLPRYSREYLTGRSLENQMVTEQEIRALVTRALPPLNLNSAPSSGNPSPTKTTTE